MLKVENEALQKTHEREIEKTKILEIENANTKKE